MTSVSYTYISVPNVNNVFKYILKFSAKIQETFKQCNTLKINNLLSLTMI